MYQISPESPKFYRSYYKKNILGFFSGHTVVQFMLVLFELNATVDAPSVNYNVPGANDSDAVDDDDDDDRLIAA